MTAATSKMVEHFVAIIHKCQPLIAIATTNPTSNVAAILDLPLYADFRYNSLQVLQILNNLY